MLGVALSACGHPVLVQPTSAELTETNYIYFVEQKPGRGSIVKRCEIMANNSVVCESQYDLD
jgi:hypothetical protein